MVLGTGIPIGFTIVSWIFLLVRCFGSLTTKVGAIMCIVLLGIAMVLHYIPKKRTYSFRKISPEFVFLMMFIMILFYKLIDKSFIKNGVDSSGTVFSDLPFHLSLVSSFAYGANSISIDTVTPFYMGEKLCYPIIPDFYSAVLVGAGGSSLRISVTIPTILLCIGLVLILHGLALQISNQRFVPELTVILFLFAGGIGWKYMFIPKCWNNPNCNAAHCFCSGKDTFWIHEVVHFLLPQRSGLFSMPIVMSVMSLLINAVETELKSIKLIVLAGLMMGFIPMLSAHSFIAIGEYALAICAIYFPWTNIKKWKDAIIFWAIFAMSVLVIGLPQIIWLSRTPRRGFFKVEAIWKETNADDRFGLIQMWWESLGAFAFMALFMVWRFLTKKQILSYIASMVVFLISSYLRYQPGAMDNTKVFNAGWFPLACIYTALLYIVLVQQTKKYKFLIVVVLIAVFIGTSASSVVCYYKALKFNFALFTQEEKALGLWAMENTRKDIVFLTSTWHSNPLMSIGGRVLTMGYGGWVWTHGLNYPGRVQYQRKIIANRENITKFLENKIYYALQHSYDKRRQFEFPTPDEGSHWMKIVDINNAKLYRLLTII